MGRVVGAYATSHTMFPSAGVEKQAQRVVEGFAELGRRIRDQKPDVVVMVSSEHGPTLLPSGPQPPFTVAVTESFPTFGEMNIPKVQIPSNADFASGFISYGGGRGFDLASMSSFRADHGLAIPILMMFPDNDIAVVPLIVSTQSPASLASARRCYNLGALLADYAGERDETVAVVGCGGLSHWPGTPQMGRINEQFDEDFLALLAAGDAGYAASWSNDHILEHAGNGGLEIRNWLFAAGAIGDPGGEILYYEPIKPWVTGMSAFAFTS
ncbi:hypothetical protein PDG61_20290 [Mycolicibacterium sp. BiH015]|uniref:DODA-type extradiol aromatic ring-opening family dioxygenase n=1 Tax=Mycolicibacterium sp. BiH015 TaxID=3018808 RepID=UPI0022E5137A|nr:hypothetical protein [Mycolicibacterium sp. BiH015]MDA2893271.1 hypothetical protein [Mycolicibacterium sp. BiH015]